MLQRRGRPSYGRNSMKITTRKRESKGVFLSQLRHGGNYAGHKDNIYLNKTYQIFRK